MIEAYAFLVMFAFQILAMSIVLPAWVGRNVKAKAKDFPAARFEQLYPGVDHQRIRERYLRIYRVANAVIVVLGLALLGWLFNYMQSPDWDDGPVEARVGAYFLLQALPMICIAVLSIRYGQLLERLLDAKRKATLKRRGLFDFVSPFTVALAALSYILFVAYVMVIAQDPFPGFAGPLANIIPITMVFALQAFGVYYLLYRRRVDPLETSESRIHTTGVGVRACVYMCIACVVNLSINFTLVRMDLQRWEPFAQSAFFVLTAIFAFMAITASPRQPESGGFSASAAP
jgi:MFS family permease